MIIEIKSVVAKAFIIISTALVVAIGTPYGCLSPTDLDVVANLLGLHHALTECVDFLTHVAMACIANAHVARVEILHELGPIKAGINVSTAKRTDATTHNLTTQIGQAQNEFNWLNKAVVLFDSRFLSQCPNRWFRLCVLLLGFLVIGGSLGYLLRFLNVGETLLQVRPIFPFLAAQIEVVSQRLHELLQTGRIGTRILIRVLFEELLGDVGKLILTQDIETSLGIGENGVEVRFSSTKNRKSNID